MSNYFKFIIFLLFLLITVTYNLQPVLAVCPVCTIAVGAGLGLSRYLGIDDIISGLWVGGLILSSGLWFADWLKKRGVQIKISVLNVVSCISFYLLVIAPLYFSGIIGHPYNMIFGIDKLVFGIIFGSLVFILAVRLDKTVRKLNGKQLFPFEKVVFPVFSLIIMSIIFYFALAKTTPFL